MNVFGFQNFSQKISDFLEEARLAWVSDPALGEEEHYFSSGENAWVPRLWQAPAWTFSS